MKFGRYLPWWRVVGRQSMHRMIRDDNRSLRHTPPNRIHPRLLSNRRRCHHHKSHASVYSLESTLTPPTLGSCDRVAVDDRHAKYALPKAFHKPPNGRLSPPWNPIAP